MHRCVEAVWYRMTADSGCAEFLHQQVSELLPEHGIAKKTTKVAARLEHLSFRGTRNRM